MAVTPGDLGEQPIDVLIVGGGNAGLSVAARLLRRGVRCVAVIEPLAVHTYRPLLSYVGGGQASVSSAERTQAEVTPDGCTWLQDTVIAVHADTRTVRCVSGRLYRYDDLVLAPGLVPDGEALPGVDAALGTPAVTSNYVRHAEKTWQLVRALQSGRAVFTVPRAPVSCTGTTLKPLFLAAAHWQRMERNADIDLVLLVDRPSLLGVPDIDDRLHHRLDELGVDVRYDTAVTALHPDERRVSTSGGDLEYDFLHLVPPFRGPPWVETCLLAADATHGLVDVDPKTLRHCSFPHIWALGDAANVATDPSGGAIRKQSAVLVDNLLAARRGAELTEYDGYTVAPVATGARRIVFGEFDREGRIQSSLPSFVDPLQPSRLAWAFDRYGLPRMYWSLILKGRL